MEKMEMFEGKAAIIAFSALCLTQSCFSAFTTTPNNWRKGLMGQIPTLGTPFRRKETTIKMEWRETKREAETPPTHQGYQEKLLRPCRGPILSGKLSPSQLDREEHRVNCYPYTKV